MFSSGRQPPLTAGADDGSPLGGPLAQIGAWELLALAAWAIAPRRRTMLSGPGPQLLRIADRPARTGTMPRCTTTGSPQ
jgi:hypothetical protein